VAIRLDGSNAAALNNRGYAWRKLGQYDRAVEDYSRSLQIDPDNIKTYNNRCVGIRAA
jgi:tetratricopeptide (TPR) repeat protein